MTARRIKPYVLVIGIVGLVFAFFMLRPLPILAPETTRRALVPTDTVMVGETRFRVEVVRDREMLARGLSGTDPLGNDEGMLFVFPKSGTHLFWMKEMHYPIDIIWFDDAGQVIFIKEHADPSSYPETFGPKEESRYVLEISAGAVQEKNIEIGDQLILSFEE